MKIQTIIKNELYNFSYVIPFTTKYRAYGKKEYIKRTIPVIAKTKVIKEQGIKRNVATNTLRLFKEVELDYSPENHFYYHIDEGRTIAVKGNVISNFTLDYNQIINGSFDRLSKMAINTEGRYGKNAGLIREAVYCLHKRIIEYLKKSGYTNILPLYEGMLDRKAEHFDEGLQRILFFNQIMWQTRHRLNGLGRIDKILGNLYKKDIEAGYLTREQAYKYIKDFLDCLHRHYEFKSAALLGDIGQIIVLGGVEEDGEYFCNELTHLFMRAHKELAYPDPKILLRVSENMPQELLMQAVECLMGRSGSPILSNDDVIIDKLIRFGIEKTDAYEYCVSACWEPYVVGKSLDQNNMDCFDFGTVLDHYLKDTDWQVVNSFESLVKGYGKYLRKELNGFIRKLDDLQWAEDPLVSMFIDSCTKRQKDISRGGAIYNNYGFTTVGIAATCDSLLNLRELCFHQKAISLEEIEKQRRDNYSENKELYESLRQRRKCFGHDDRNSIELVNYIIRCCNHVLAKHRNRLGGKVKIGLSSPSYIDNGKSATADFAGRLNGMPYATHISSSDSGYTELIGFAASLDYSGHNINGNVVDFFVQPNIIADDKDKFAAFLRGAIRRGFYQLQMNIIDSATLIDAKKHPEKHKNLIVRVWGFSAYFTDLPEEYKDRLIERALESEKWSA
ncbi:MAG: hypothetical protein J6N53_16910 [Lachnospiraceae bacterium]|nr:hypothetical protein [Lachnospiraceae bacterium]MBO6300513.1 hypothetical protein [Lachnospiraceae bacterium]